MKLYRKEESRLKRPFIIIGIVIGALASGWYLYHNQAGEAAPGNVTVPDPFWTQCVNVALIMFSAIYVLNLCRRIVELLLKKKQA
jgi:hypothetical protein